MTEKKHPYRVNGHRGTPHNGAQDWVSLEFSQHLGKDGGVVNASIYLHMSPDEAVNLAEDPILAAEKARGHE